MTSVPIQTAGFRPGDVIERRYQILEQIADGGMGTVFLAQHLLIKRRVALKLLHRELASDHNMVLRFLDEASAAGTLGHPNIVESTDMGFTRDNVPYIVFEYLEGALLTDEIYRVHGLPVPRALRIARQIASALDAAHGAGIAHLDLKSDNIFLTHRDGTLDHVKVLDFGIARFLEPDRERTQRGILVGTPEYMAPEQVTTPDAIDHRADVYGLGVVMYEMLAGRRPFDGEDPRALLHRIVHEPPPPLDRAGVPPELSAMIERMLAKDPANRFASMRDVEAALDEVGIARRARRASPMHRTLPLGDRTMRQPAPSWKRSSSVDIPVDDLAPAPKHSPPPKRSRASEVEDVDRWIADHRRPWPGWFVGALLAAMVAGGLYLIRTNLDAPPVASVVHSIRADLDLVALAHTLHEVTAMTLVLAGVLLMVYVGAWVRRRDAI